MDFIPTLFAASISESLSPINKEFLQSILRSFAAYKIIPDLGFLQSQLFSGL